MKRSTTRTRTRDDVPSARSAADGEEGAMSVLVGLTAFVSLLAVVLAVDLGSYALADRDLQGAVDLAALDAVQAVGELATGDTGLQALATELADASLARNDGWSARDGRDVTVTVGVFDEATRTFTPTTVQPDAVLVEASTQLARLTGILPGRDPIQHRAVATNVGQGSVSIGTSVGSLDSDRSVVLNRALSRLFGRDSDLSLDLVGYEGLASGTISLRRLAADLGLASPAELADTTVSVGRLFAVAAAGLSASGDPLDLSAATPLTTLATEVGTSQSIHLGSLLDLEVGAVGALADVEVSALDLVTVTAQLVNGTNVVDLGMPIAVPGVGTGSITLAVLEPPQIAAGRAGTDPTTGEWRTEATTGQLRLGIDLDLAALDLDGLTVSALHVPLVVEAAQGSAPLQSITCANATLEPSVTSPVTTSAVTTTLGELPADLASASTPVPVDPASIASVTLDAPLLGALDLGTLVGQLQTTIGADQQLLTFVGPYAEAQQTSGSSSLGGTPRVPRSGEEGRVGLAAALDTSDLGLTSALDTSLDLQTDVLDPILDATTPILDEVDRRVVGPLLESLGVSLGRADVTITDVDCGARLLVE